MKEIIILTIKKNPYIDIQVEKLSKNNICPKINGLTFIHFSNKNRFNARPHYITQSRLEKIAYVMFTFFNLIEESLFLSIKDFLMIFLDIYRNLYKFL